jgi:hypothetical protein
MKNGVLLGLAALGLALYAAKRAEAIARGARKSPTLPPEGLGDGPRVVEGWDWLGRLLTPRARVRRTGDVGFPMAVKG